MTIRITYDPELVEEAVLAAESGLPRAEARAFRRERDSIYEISGSEAREAWFRAFHLRWFARLKLGEPVERALAERPELAARLPEGRIVRALTRREEGADLIDRVGPASDGEPMLVVRVRPTALAAPDGLLESLRHELQHVADMLDPEFGYERDLPSCGDGPPHDNAVRDRYRVLWDVTIDGRLARRGLVGARALDRRWNEFAETFHALGDRCRRVFDAWLECPRPTHTGLAAFALMQGGGGNDAGRCPLCRFPVAALDPRPDRLSCADRAAIETEHPGWTIEQGACPQCLDLYQARNVEARDAGGAG